MTEIKATVVDRLPADESYIKLYKESKRFNWEIKCFKHTTQADMDAIKKVIDDTHKKMDVSYGTEVV